MAGKKNGTAVAIREEIPVVLQRLNTVLAGEEGPSEMELLVQESDESETIELERVKIATGGKEKFDRDDDLTDSITGIIVSAQTARGYWESEGTKGTPFCSSVDGKFGEISTDVTPDSARLVAANNPAKPHPYAQAQSEGNRIVKCIDCPLNKWGSDPKGGEGKACKETRLLLIQEEEKRIPVILSLSPMSLKPFKAYATKMTGDKSAFFAVLTELGVKEQSSTGGFDYGIVTLKKKEDLTLDVVKEVIALQKSYAEHLRDLAVTGDDYEDGDTVDTGDGQVIEGTSEDVPF